MSDDAQLPGQDVEGDQCGYEQPQEKMLTPHALGGTGSTASGAETSVLQDLGVTADAGSHGAFLAPGHAHYPVVVGRDGRVNASSP